MCDGELLRQACVGSGGRGTFCEFHVRQDLADGRLSHSFALRSEKPKPFCHQLQEFTAPAWAACARAERDQNPGHKMKVRYRQNSFSRAASHAAATTTDS